MGSLSLTPGDLPNPGIETRSPTLQADFLPVEPQGKPVSGDFREQDLCNTHNDSEYWGQKKSGK